MGNVLLIGASGFIGKRVLRILLASISSVHVITRSDTKFLDSNSANLTVHKADITMPNDLKSINWSEFDVIINCSGELHNIKNMHKLHVDALKNILPLLRKGTHWIQLSSAGVYGNPTRKTVKNGDKFKAKGMYEVTKALGELLVERYCKENFLKYSIIRPTIVFAEDMPNDSIRQLIDVIIKKRFIFFSKGNNTYLNYIHADDVASVICKAVNSEEFTNTSINISNQISLTDFYNLVISIKKVEPYFRYIPKKMSYILVFFMSVIPNFPLTIKRLNALTNETIYISDINFEKDDFDSKLKSFIRSSGKSES